MQTYVWAHKRPWNKNCVLLAVVAVINKSIEERNSFCLWYRQVGEVFQELFVIIVDRESYFTRQSQFWWILKKAAFVGGLLLGLLSGRKSGWLLWCRRGIYWWRYWFGDWNCFSGPLFLRDSSAQCSLKASVCFGPLFTVIKSHTSSIPWRRLGRLLRRTNALCQYRSWGICEKHLLWSQNYHH